LCYSFVAMPSLLILASGSPRRKQMLTDLRLPFTIDPADVDETPLPDEPADAMVLRLARDKADVVAARHPHDWVLASDTTVALESHVLGKPKDADDARRMLNLLQGRTHQVHTAICLRKGSEVYDMIDTSNVTFRAMTPEQIDWYVATGEPLDKAGAYAIQGTGGLFIERLDGSFATVMGLCTEKLCNLLDTLGLLDGWLGING